MRIGLLTRRSLATAVGATVILGAPVLSESLLDKLKKQAQQTIELNTAQAKKTLEESAGLDTSDSSNTASLRADAERMWKVCYDQMLMGAEYSKCASVCNMASKSIADFEGAAKANKTTWQRCKSSHDTALASAKPAMVQSEKEKELGLPAGAMSNGKAAQNSLPGTAASTPTANNNAAAKPAAKPASKPAATPVASKPTALDAPAKAAVDKFAASCPTGILATTYDCGCLAEEYGNTVMSLRAERASDWEKNGKTYEENQLKAAKAMAAEKNEPKFVENAQKRIEADRIARKNYFPDHSEVANRLQGESGTGKRCYSRAAMVKSQTQECLDTPSKKTPFGTPTDATYCGCLANETAANILDKGMQFGPARNDANLSCDPAVSGALKGAKKK